MAGFWTTMMHESNKKNESEKGIKTKEIWMHEHDLKKLCRNSAHRWVRPAMFEPLVHHLSKIIFPWNSGV